MQTGCTPLKIDFVLHPARGETVRKIHTPVLISSFNLHIISLMLRNFITLHNASIPVVFIFFPPRELSL